MRRSIVAASVVAAVVLVPHLALAQPPLPCAGTADTGFLTGLARVFDGATQAWGAVALDYAGRIFMLLVAIEIAFSAITYVLQKDNLADFLAGLVLKVLSVAFFWMLMRPNTGPAWIADIVASFMQLGSAIGGQPQFGPGDPSMVFRCGIDVGAGIILSSSVGVVNQGIGDWLPNLALLFTAFACAAGVALAFAVVAAQLLVTLIESYIVIGAGLVQLGFAGSRWTLVFTENYIGYVFSVGIKLFMLELIVGLGYGLGAEWVGLFLNGVAPPETYIEAWGAALIFMIVAWQVPSNAASLMTGSPRLTLGTFMSTIGTTAVGAMTLVSGAAALVRGPAAVEEVQSVTRAAASDVSVMDNTVGRVPNATASRHAEGKEAQGAAARTSPDTASTTRATPSRSTDDARDDETQSSRNASSTPEANGADSPDGQAARSEAPESPIPDADREAESAAGEVSDSSQSASTEGTSSAASASRKATPRSIRSFGIPQTPSDSAEGSVRIRFKHPD